MSKLRLYGSTSGYNELTVPAVADNSELNIGNLAGNTYVTGTFSSNTYVAGTFVSNNYFEEEKVTLGSFADMSDYNLSSLGGSLIHASATGGVGGNTYSIPSTASTVYIWAQGAGGDSGTARSTDVNSSASGGNGGGGSKVCTKISITHKPHSTLTDLYCEFNPQGDAVVYIGTSNSGVEIARGYKGNVGASVSGGTDNNYGDGGDLQLNVSGKSIASSSTSAYTQTTITDKVTHGTLSKYFPKFIGPYLENGSPCTPLVKSTTVNDQGISGAGLFSGGVQADNPRLTSVLGDSRDGIDAHTFPWSFGVGAIGPFSNDENNTVTRPAGEGGYACAVIIVR